MADDKLGTFHISEFIGRVNGGDHLNAEHRLAWFHEVHGARGGIATELLHHTTFAEAGAAASAVFKATVTIYGEEGVPFVYVGHGSESQGDFGDYVMKAETKAIARALGHAGFGTLDAQVRAGTAAPSNGRGRPSRPSVAGPGSPAAVAAPAARPAARPLDDDQARNRARYLERQQTQQTQPATRGGHPS